MSKSQKRRTNRPFQRYSTKETALEWRELLKDKFGGDWFTRNDIEKEFCVNRETARRIIRGFTHYGIPYHSKMVYPRDRGKGDSRRILAFTLSKRTYNSDSICTNRDSSVFTNKIHINRAFKMYSVYGNSLFGVKDYQTLFDLSYTVARKQFQKAVSEGYYEKVKVISHRVVLYRIAKQGHFQALLRAGVEISPVDDVAIEPQLFGEYKKRYGEIKMYADLGYQLHDGKLIPRRYNGRHNAFKIFAEEILKDKN